MWLFHTNNTKITLLCVYLYKLTGVSVFLVRTPERATNILKVQLLKYFTKSTSTSQRLETNRISGGIGNTQTKEKWIIILLGLYKAS